MTKQPGALFIRYFSGGKTAGSVRLGKLNSAGLNSAEKRGNKQHRVSPQAQRTCAARRGTNWRLRRLFIGSFIAASPETFSAARANAVGPEFAGALGEAGRVCVAGEGHGG